MSYSPTTQSDYVSNSTIKCAALAALFCGFVCFVVSYVLWFRMFCGFAVACVDVTVRDQG